MKNVDTLVVISIIAVVIGLIGVSYMYTEAQDAKVAEVKEQKEISAIPDNSIDSSTSVGNDLSRPDEVPEPDHSLSDAVPLKDISSDDLTGAEGFEPTSTGGNTNKNPASKAIDPLVPDKNSNNLVENTNQKMKMTTQQKTSLTKPVMQIDPSKTYTAMLSTNMGDIVIKLDPLAKPITVNNFVALSNMGYYDDVIFHRIIDGFMIQGGDPLGTGTGGPGYSFKDELGSPNINKRGTIAMANAGPNTNGSQFFINHADNNFLDTKHTVFGEVISGMDVVDAIAKVDKGPNDKPINDVVIKTVAISTE